MSRQLKHVTGMETVDRAFRHLTGPGAVTKITQALNKGAEEVADRARTLAPEDDGAVRRSIGHEIIKTDRRRGGVAAIIFAGGRKAPGGFRSEFGRAPGGAGSQKSHPGHGAQPFMFPAYHSIRKRVRSRIKRAMAAVAKEAARHGR